MERLWPWVMWCCCHSQVRSSLEIRSTKVA